MRETLALYNQERIAKNRRPINIGIGIHSGPLMLGIIGDQARMDTGVVADTVNTASRMEALTKDYGSAIILSETTFASLPTEAPALRKLDRFRVKGKKKPLDIYEVLSGEPAARRNKKLETMGLFASGLKFWLDKSIEEAHDVFTKILASDPKDLAARFLFKKVARERDEGFSGQGTSVDG